MTFFAAIGRMSWSVWEGMGSFLELCGELAAALRFRPQKREFLRQMNFVANESLLMICICVSFAAVVTVLESSFHMKLVIQNDSMVPGFASLLILRELGVVLMALLLTSRVGAGMAAEVATMAVTEQIDALKLLGLEPVRFLVVPRFLACLVAGVLLTVIANMVCLTGAMLVSSLHLGFAPEVYWEASRLFVDFKDLVLAMVKGAVFAGIIPVVACYYGFRCRGGAEGVGKATTQAVVASTLLIILSDFLLTYIFTYIY